MVGEVVGINGGETDYRSAEPSTELVEKLEWLLECARAGDLQGLVGATLFADGSTGSVEVATETPMCLVGQIYSTASRVASHSAGPIIMMVEDDDD